MQKANKEEGVSQKVRKSIRGKKSTYISLIRKQLYEAGSLIREYFTVWQTAVQFPVESYTM